MSGEEFLMTTGSATFDLIIRAVLASFLLPFSLSLLHDGR